MDTNQSPALVPALCAVLGTLLAPRPFSLPLAAVVAVLALALVLRSPAARGLAALVLGLLNAGVREPAVPLEAWLAPSRPVEIVGRIGSHPILRQDRILVRLHGETLRQGREIRTRPVEVWVSLASESAPPALGTRIRLRGYLKKSGVYANGLDSGGRPPVWRLHLQSERFLTVEAPGGGLWPLVAELRRLASGLVAPHHDRWRVAALIEALILGDRSALPETWLQALRRCGLAHLLAVSGLHVGVVTLCVLWAAAFLPPRWRLLLAAAVVLLYLALIGPRPPVMRASLMGLLAAAALLGERPPQAVNALACAVLLLVSWDPSIVGEIGFQLSVAATAGILLWTPLLSRRWRKVPKWLRQPLAVSVAAQAATLPWTLALSAGLHPLAVLFNLIFIPWLALMVAAGLLWLFIAAVSSTASAWLLPGLEVLASPVDVLASLPPGHAFLWPLACPSWLAWSAPLALIAAWWRPAAAARVGVVMVMFALTGSGPPRQAADEVELLLIDVGQGDAILLRDGRRAVLIDGGGWPSGDLGGRVLLPVLAAAGVDRLDAVVLTHPDLDHCAGLADLARYLPVDELWMSSGWAERPCAGEVLTTPGKRWRVWWRGRRAEVGRWRIEVLHPPPHPATAGGRFRHSDNDRSLVLAAEVFGLRVLLSGDAEAAAERALSRRAGGASELRAAVLKVAHHGSRTSTTPAFLAAVTPRLALISAGRRNPYGHPAPEVQERLHGAGVRVLRTDRSGMIRLRFHPSGRISFELPAQGVAAYHSSQSSSQR
ncbi:MAG: DNA internalization-related competence protein ComEC/Rec2 [Thermoanaerobaculia bacterium]